MNDIKKLKLKDTKLINEICDLGDITIDERRRWSIEFDDYGIQGVVDAIRKQFVEQACEVTEVVRKRAEYGYSVDSAYDKGLYQAAVEIQQAIKDKFK